MKAIAPQLCALRLQHLSGGDMWLPLPLHPKMDPRRDELPPKLDITYIDVYIYIY